MAKTRCTAYLKHSCMKTELKNPTLICCHSCASYDVCNKRCENKPGLCNKAVTVDDDDYLYAPMSKERRTSSRKKRVAKFDLKTGEMLGKYSSMTEAAASLEGEAALTNKVSGISACANGKARYAYGFYWRFV